MEDIKALYEDFQNGLYALKKIHNENSNNENYRNNESEIYMNIDEICENLEESIKTLTPKIKKSNKMRIVEIRLKIHNYREAKKARYASPKFHEKVTVSMNEFNSNNEDNNNSYRSVKKSKRRTARRGLSLLRRKPTFSSTRKSKSYRK